MNDGGSFPLCPTYFVFIDGDAGAKVNLTFFIVLSSYSIKVLQQSEVFFY